MSPLGKGSSMASPVLRQSEGVQGADGDDRPNGELREANRNMHEFLDLLGHELRSPLAAICTPCRCSNCKGTMRRLGNRCGA